VKLVRIVFALGGVLPWARALLDRELPLSSKLAVDRAFAALCHHLPERTLAPGGAPMCVCSRCAGVYAGVMLAALWPTGLLPPPRTLRRALEIGLSVMALDIVTQDLALHPPWHLVRLATGLWVGGALTAWMLSEIARQRFRATLSRATHSAFDKASVARPA
jgi:uncharacterized membrane protein